MGSLLSAGSQLQPITALAWAPDRCDFPAQHFSNRHCPPGLVRQQVACSVPVMSQHSSVGRGTFRADQLPVVGPASGRPPAWHAHLSNSSCFIPATVSCPCRQRLAAATSERVVLIFGVQGDKLDKFKTKPAVANQLVSYSIRSLVWSADSTILAVAQSDGAIFGFRLGAVGSQEKKAICSRIVTGSPPTCLTWLPGLQDGLAFGCVDGRVRTPPELRGKV